MKWFLRQVFRHRFDCLILGFYCFTLCFLIIALPYYVDVKSHNLLLLEYLNSGFFPIPPGYYGLIYLLDLVIRVKYPFVASSAIVLTFFFWWKYRIIYSWIRNTLPAINENIGFSITFSFLLLSPIYIPLIDGQFWYLGKFTQTIWHNSTLICVFPLCILLVQRSLRWVHSAAFVDLFAMLGLALLIMLIKPSFLLAFIPAFPVYLFIRERKVSKRLIQGVAFVMLLFLLILVEKYLIFTWDPMLGELYTDEEMSEVVLRPLKVWKHFSQEPIFDFVSSFPLLILFLILWRKKAFDSQLFRFSLILLLFSLAIYLLLAETGFREFHGNFYWQIPIALCLCHLAIVFTVAGEFLEAGKKYKPQIVAIFAVYLFQAIWGLGYWLRIFTDFIVS